MLIVSLKSKQLRTVGVTYSTVRGNLDYQMIEVTEGGATNTTM